MDHYSLLSLLADGRLHSGAELAERLGVSRTAVWKQLRRIEGLGLELETVRGHGYRLSSPIDLLDDQRIIEALPADCRRSAGVRVVGAVDSTNQELLARPALSASYDILIAEQQLKGRGRRGRSWASPFARNLYLSFAYETEGNVEALQGITLLAGIALAEALTELGVPGVQVKWPNDIWVKGRKLAGILTELQGTVQDRFRIVIGVGVNVYMGDLGDTIDQPWTSLAREGITIEGGRNQLAARLIQRLLAWLGGGAGIADPAFRRAWNSFDALAGHPVLVKDRALSGLANGLDEAGQLRLLGDDGQECCLNAGEVSIRMVSDDSSG